MQETTEQASYWTLLAVRHAEAEDAHDGADPPLSPIGLQQAARLAERLAAWRFDRVYVSTMRRTRETAHCVCSRHPDAPIEMCDDLREIMHFHCADEAIPEDAALRDAVMRERDLVQRISNRLWQTHHPGQRVLLVAHGNLIRTLLPILAGREPRDQMLMELDCASLSEMRIGISGRSLLYRLNDTSHLG